MILREKAFCYFLKAQDFFRRGEGPGPGPGLGRGRGGLGGGKSPKMKHLGLFSTYAIF